VRRAAGSVIGWSGVAPDVWYTYADLEWKDIDVENLRWLAFWAHLPGTDQINMNAYYLSSASDFERRMAAAHEFGHALGIDDHYSSAYSDQLMYYEASSVNTPQSHDVDDYNTLWK
jgi:predicted Zn-dependent protease